MTANMPSHNLYGKQWWWHSGTFWHILHGSAFLAAGSLVGGGRLMRMICNNFCDHKYEEWH